MGEKDGRAAINARAVSANRLDGGAGGRRAGRTGAEHQGSSARPGDSEVYSPANLRAVLIGNHHTAQPSHFAPVL